RPALSLSGWLPGARCCLRFRLFAKNRSDIRAASSKVVVVVLGIANMDGQHLGTKNWQLNVWEGSFPRSRKAGYGLRNFSAASWAAEGTVMQEENARQLGGQIFALITALIEQLQAITRISAISFRQAMSSVAALIGGTKILFS